MIPYNRLTSLLESSSLASCFPIVIGLSAGVLSTPALSQQQISVCLMTPSGGCAPVSSTNAFPVVGGTSGGGGGSNFGSAFPAAGMAAGYQYSGGTLPTNTAGTMVPAQVDQNGRLIISGGGTNFNATFPATGQAAGFQYSASLPTNTAGQMVPAQVDQNGRLFTNGGVIQAINPYPPAIWTSTISQSQQIVTNASGTLKTYVTGWWGMVDGTAAGVADFQIVAGTGTTCGTSTQNLTPKMTFSPGNGISRGSGLGSMFIVPVNTNVCIKTTSTNLVEGGIDYVLQ